MELRQHEKWIKEQLGADLDKVDTNALWDDLQGFVPARRDTRKRFLLIVLLVGTGFALTVGLSYFVQIQSLSTEKERNTQTSLSPRGYAIEEDSKNSCNDEIVNSTAEVVKKNQKQVKENTHYQKLHNTLDDQTKEITEAHERKWSEELLQESELPTSSQQLSLKEVANIAEENIRTRNTIKVELPIVIEGNEKAKTNAFDSDQKTARKLLVMQYEQERTVHPINLLSSHNLTMLIQEIITPNPLFVTTVGKKNHGLSFSYLVGTNVNVDSYTLRNQEYQRIYDEVPSNLPGITSGMTVSYMLAPKWSISGGLLFTQAVTRLTHSYENTIVSKGEGIQQLFVNSNGTVAEQQGEVNIYDIERSAGIWHQFENKFATSLSINYRVFKRRRLQLNVGGGALIPLLNFNRGSSLVGDEEVLKISNARNLKFNNSKVNPFGSTELSYRINKKIGVGILGFLYFEQQEQNTDNISSVLNRKSYNIGLTCSYHL